MDDDIKVQLRIDRSEWKLFDESVAQVSADADPALSRSSEMRRMIRDYVAQNHPDADVRKTQARR